MSFMNDDISFIVIPIKDIEDGKKYKIRVEMPTRLGFIEDLNFVLLGNGGSSPFLMKFIEEKDNKAIFETEIDLPTCAVVRYYFSYALNGQRKYALKNSAISDSLDYNNLWKMSINFEVPEWAKGKIMYHIFVDRFRRGSKEKMKEMPRRRIHESWNEEMIIGPDENGIWNADFYGGDLKGIEEALDYIKSLGVSILYLSPVMSSQSNHRYDTADYEIVDPYAGCNEDLKNLCDSAHRKGMKVVLDAVFNHTGNDSKYFNQYGTFDTVGAFQSGDSPYASFYRTYDDNGQKRFDYWWGMTNLPVCNGYSKEWQNYIYGENGIIDQWFRLDIDGLRLDVADELSDEFIEGIRRAVKRNKKDGFIIGEVWKNPMHMGRGYLSSGKGMDTVMNYSLIDAIIRYFKYGDVNKLASIIRDIRNEYPDGTVKTLMNFTSTHDISRAIDLFGTYDFQEYGEWSWNPTMNDLNWCTNYKLSPSEYKHAREVYEAYVFMLTFMPGILSIFYGDEVGVQGMGNLVNRKPYPWGMRDKKLLEFFRYIGRIRQTESFLEDADTEVFDINENYMMFERKSRDGEMLVAVNRTNEEKDFPVPGEYEKHNGIYVLKKSRNGHLNPYGGIAIKKD